MSSSRPVAVLAAACLLLAVAACSGGGDPTAAGTTTVPTGAAAPLQGQGAGATGGGAPVAATPAPDVAAEGTGDVTQEVPDRTLVTNPPVPLDGTGDFGDGFTARLSTVRPVTADARLPGEVGGDAVSVTLDLDNASSGPVDLTSVTVELQDASGVPATLLESQSSPVSGSLGPGRASSGTYVFSYPAGRSGAGTIAVTSSTEEPIVLFAGSVR